MLDYIHTILAGPSGSGKSWLSATSPEPQLVALFDSLGNARAYFRNCRVKQERDVVIVLGRPSIIPTYLCYALEDTECSTLKRKLWAFDTSTSIGIDQFKVKWAILSEEMRACAAKTFIFDSLTLYQTGLRVAGKDSIGSSSEDERALAYSVTDDIEALGNMLKSLPFNVIMAAHISGRNYKKSVGRGANARILDLQDTSINAPGRMGRNLESMFSDVWLTYVDDEGNYLVNTNRPLDHDVNSKDTIVAKNTVNSPGVCPNNWLEIVKGSDPTIWL